MRNATPQPDPWHEDEVPAGEVVAIGGLKVITLPVLSPRAQRGCEIAGWLIGTAVFGGLVPAVYWSVVWSCRAARLVARRWKR